MTIINPNKEDCKSLIEDARRFFENGKERYEKYEWNLVVKNCIDSMELSLKGILGLIIGKYPRTHDFQNNESKILYQEAKRIILDVHSRDKFYFDGLFLRRLFFIPSMWSKSYTNARYGDDWGTKVYQKLEADFILKQTKEFVDNAETVYDDIIGW